MRFLEYAVSTGLWLKAGKLEQTQKAVYRASAIYSLWIVPGIMRQKHCLLLIHICIDHTQIWKSTATSWVDKDFFFVKVQGDMSYNVETLHSNTEMEICA